MIRAVGNFSSEKFLRRLLDALANTLAVDHDDPWLADVSAVRTHDKFQYRPLESFG